MPSFRTVTFASPSYSRLPRDDEAYVMKAFARHAGHCPSCYDAYGTYRRGGTLCPKGHQRALDVAQYVFNRDGQAYSVVDREGNKRVQIEIPVGCDAVRSLLRAMELGLRVMKRAPSVSYDRTYYIPPRTSSLPAYNTVTREPSPSYRTRAREPSPAQPARAPRLETAEPPRYVTRGRVISSGARIYGKGSMYEADLRDRQPRYKPPVYYRVREVSPPVPPKDYFYTVRR